MTDLLETHVHLLKPGPKGDARTLLLLHGTGDDERSFSRVGAVVAPEAAVLSVRGNVRENGMNRFFRRRAEGVYDMEDLARRTAELIAFIDAAVRHYELDRAGLVGIGYSNGANILASMLFRDASVAPAAVLMHPLIPFAPPANPGLAGNRILITAGERDPLCPPALSRSLHGYFEQQGARSRLLFHPGGHELVPEEIESASTFIAEARPVAPRDARATT
jgi:phospholipase/carboxylesterase